MAVLKSKKFWAMIAAVATAVGSGFTGVQGWELIVPEVIGIVMTYIIAQGVADMNKEAEKIKKEK